MCNFHEVRIVIFSPPPVKPPTFGSWLFSPYRRFDSILPAAASRAEPERTLLRVVMRRIKFHQPHKYPFFSSNISF